MLINGRISDEVQLSEYNGILNYFDILSSKIIRRHEKL